MGARWAISLSLFGFASVVLAGRGDVYGGAALPVDRTFLIRPTISWNVYTTGADHVVSGKIILNGNELTASYDEKSQRVVAVPDKALAPGKYQVLARVVFAGGLAYKTEWDFEVLPAASSDLPAPNNDQIRAVEIVNALRDRLGLQPMQMDPRLCAAALKHTVYNKLNNTTGHFERPGLPGFIGEGPAQRIQAFGYDGDSYEAVSFGCLTLQDGVQSLIDAPYHRIPFFQPGKLLVGAGALGERLTLDFQLGDDKAVFVYPADGQTDVPVSWGKLERPNPLRIHPKDIGVVGYPITLVYYGKEVRLSDVHAAVRTEAGEDVPILLNTPDNDTWLRNAVILMPRKPLAAGMAYNVSISAKASDGLEINRSWKFTAATQAIFAGSFNTNVYARASSPFTMQGQALASKTLVKKPAAAKAVAVKRPSATKKIARKKPALKHFVHKKPATRYAAKKSNKAKPSIVSKAKKPVITAMHKSRVLALPSRNGLSAIAHSKR